MAQTLRYRRIPGRVMRPDAAKNARARKVGITTGLNSKAVRGVLDQRFVFAKTVSGYEREYREHCGERSVVLADLIHSAACHKTVRNIALARLMQAGPFDDADHGRAAYEAFRRADADLREVVRGLPLKKVEKEVELQDYLRETYGEKKRLPLRIRSEEEDDPPK